MDNKTMEEMIDKLNSKDKEIRELQQFNNALAEQNDCLTKANRKLQGEKEELEGTNRMWKDEIERLKKRLNEIIFVKDEKISNLRLEVRELQEEIDDLNKIIEYVDDYVPGGNINQLASQISSDIKKELKLDVDKAVKEGLLTNVRLQSKYEKQIRDIKKELRGGR